MNDIESVFNALSHLESFSKKALFSELKKTMPDYNERTFYRTVSKLIKSGELVHIGRNIYCIPKVEHDLYQHDYSELAIQCAMKIIEKHKGLDFRIFELYQLNEFMNHQIAHNMIFIHVEGNLGDFVFETLKEEYPGKVLINSSARMIEQYWQDNLIVIGKLILEAPKGKMKFWHTDLEKMLVDILAEKNIREEVIESEYPAIYEGAFSKYIVDESRMFRYAKRRGAGTKVQNYIKENTSVKLRTR